MRTLFALYIFFWHLVCVAEQITLPVTTEQGVPVVVMKISGTPHRFMLDTGASDQIYLTESDAKQIAGLAYTGKKRKSMDLSGRVQESEEFIINALAVDGMNFANMSGRIYKYWGIALGEGAKGPPDISVIGMSFFNNKKLLLDLAAQQMTVFDSAEPMPEAVRSWTVVPFELTSEGMVVTLSSATAHYRMVLDSAASMSLVKEKRIAANEETGTCPLDLGPKRACRYIEVTLPGDSPMTPVLMDLPDQFDADGILGREFFERYAVFVDLATKTLKVRISAK